jgi:hypothetical protein
MVPETLAQKEDESGGGEGFTNRRRISEPLATPAFYLFY